MTTVISNEDAHYYVDKAIETAQLGVKILDPSIAYRLLGNACLGKASIYMPKRHWKEASELYRQGAKPMMYVETILCVLSL